MTDRWHEPRWADADTPGYHKLLKDGWEPYAVTHRVEVVHNPFVHVNQTQEVTTIMHWFRKKMTEEEINQKLEVSND